MLPNVLRAGLQSSTIMCSADVVTQIFVEGHSLDAIKQIDNQHSTDQLSPTKPFDIQRSFRWAVAGLTLHGPYFFLGFSRIDQYFGAATHFSTVMKKTAAAQFILFPPYLVALFSYMGFMEGCSDIAKKVHDRVPEAFMGGCVFWPIANTINFSLVPGSMRVPYLALSAGLWNGYLSWANNRGNELSISSR
jgi:protein Mpv17